MSEPIMIDALVNGVPQRLDIKTPVENEIIERLTRATYRPTGGVYVCHHVPTDPDGRDFYDMFRKLNPGMNAYVGYTVFETDSIPRAWVDSCNAMDEIWVPSKFNIETFAGAGVKRDKLRVIPHGFDPDAYRPDETPPLEIGDRKGFNFLSIFEWTNRKGWDVLIRAYLEEFAAGEDVRLILRAYQGGGVIGYQSKPVIEQLADYIETLGYDPKKIPHIEFIDYMVPSDLMPSLYRSADAFVLPTRGEGWGIPFTESMLMEVPVIATRWSGHLEFMNDENAYLIDVDRITPVNEDQVKDSPFYAGHQWADPSVAHTRKLMRACFENREEAREKGRIARDHILKNFTIHHTAAMITDRAMRLESLNRRGVTKAPVVHDGRKEAPPRILFCVRPNYLTDPRDDTASVIGLKQALERAGARVDVTTFPNAPAEEYDLVHLFCLDETFALNASLRGRPFVVSPNRWITNRIDAESALVYSLLEEQLLSNDSAAYDAEIADSPLSAIPDRPIETAAFMTRAEAVLSSGPSETGALRNAFPDMPRVVELPAGFEQPLNPGRVSPDLFFEQFGVESFALCVGQLVPMKNQLMLLHALKDVDLPLVLIDLPGGHMTYDRECRKVDRISKTIYTGPVSPEMLFSAYAAARVLVQPGWDNMPGIASLQAAFCGCPVVMAGPGTGRDCMNDQVVMADPRDPQSIRDAVLAACEKGSRLSAPATPEKFSWNAQCEIVLSLYREIIDRAATPSGCEDLVRKAEAAREDLAFQQERSVAYQAMKRSRPEAHSLARSLLDRKPTDPSLWFLLGSVCLRRSEYDEAESHFRQCVALTPAPNPTGYFSLVLTLQKRGKHEEALETILRCIDLHPGAPPETKKLMFDYMKKSSREIVRKSAYERTGNVPVKGEIKG